jgi:hypothetical protein
VDGLGYPAAYFGSAIALSSAADTNSSQTLVIGAHMQSAYKGATYVYDYDVSTSAWVISARLTASNSAFGDSFGYNVAVRGTTIVSVAVDKAGGIAYVFALDSNTGVWTERQQLPAPTAGIRMGRGLALSHDTLMLGAPHDNAHGVALQGTVFVYTRQTDALGHTEFRLFQHLVMPPGALSPTSNFGHSVTVDGDVAVIGALFHLDDGAALVFTRSDGATWSHEKTLQATGDPVRVDLFGNRVVLLRDPLQLDRPMQIPATVHVVVGAESTLSATGGNAYLFQLRVGSNHECSGCAAGSSVAAGLGITGPQCATKVRIEL